MTASQYQVPARTEKPIPLIMFDELEETKNSLYIRTAMSFNLFKASLQDNHPLTLNYRVLLFSYECES